MTLPSLKMSTEYSNTIATAGAVLSMVSNIPQVYKVYYGKTDDLHVYSVILHLLSTGLWSYYGLLLNLYILAVESGICCFLNFLILLAIVRDRGIKVHRIHINVTFSNPKAKPEIILPSDKQGSQVYSRNTACDQHRPTEGKGDA